MEGISQEMIVARFRLDSRDCVCVWVCVPSAPSPRVGAMNRRPPLGAGSSERDWEHALEKHEAQQKSKRRNDKRRRHVADSEDSDAPDPAAAPSSHGHSHLLSELLQQWSWGLISAVQVQTLCAAAAADGCPHPDVVKVGNISNAGAASNHHRDLMAFMNKRYLYDFSLAPRLAGVPFKTVKGAESVFSMIQQPFVLPHELFAVLFDNFREEFYVRLVGAGDHASAEGRVSAFWRGSHPGDPRKRDCEVFQNNNYKKRGIPISLHGDGVPCSKESLMVLSWWSLLGVGSTLDTHFMSSCYFTTTEATGEYNTKPEVWKTIVWSLRACVLGVWPDRDHDDKPWARDSYESMRAGTPLAGGWFLVPWQFSGDTEFKIKHLDIPGYWGSDHPCCSCRADRSGTNHSWMHLEDDAWWMDGGSFKTHAEWLAWCTLFNTTPCLVFQAWSDGGLGMSFFCIRGDVLHSMDLGVTLEVLGNVFHNMTKEPVDGGDPIIPGEDPQARTATLWNEIKAQYRERGTEVQLSGLEHSWFFHGPTSFPVLSHAKAAEARHLAPVAFAVWRLYYDSANPKHVLIDRVLKCVVRFYNALVHDGWYLPRDEVRPFRTNMLLLLRTYLTLQRQAVRDHVIEWRFLPKHHYCYHIADEAQYQSPRLSWTYGGEDFVGKFAVLGESARHGLKKELRAGPVSSKYALALQLRWVLRRSGALPAATSELDA